VIVADGDGVTLSFMVSEMGEEDADDTELVEE